MKKQKTALQKLIDYMEENYHLTDESRIEFEKALAEERTQIENAFVAGDLGAVSGSTFRITLPLEMIWQPKEDITTYELAMCLPYFFRHHGVMPYEVDKSLPHFRHFKIIDHNIQ